MSVRVPKALRLLRDHAPEVLGAAEDVAGLVPWMNLLRDLLDTRSRQVKIEDSVLRVVGDLAKFCDDRHVAGAARDRLERWLPQLPLANVPSDGTIRRILRARDAENKRSFVPQVTHGAEITCHTTLTSSST